MVWGSLMKNDNTRTKNLLTPTVGLQFEFGSKYSVGGFTGGAACPLLYLKYNYCFLRRYTNEINSGMHFITIGLGIYYNSHDK